MLLRSRLRWQRRVRKRDRGTSKNSPLYSDPLQTGHAVDATVTGRDIDVWMVGGRGEGG